MHVWRSSRVVSNDQLDRVRGISSSFFFFFFGRVPAILFSAARLKLLRPHIPRPELGLRGLMTWHRLFLLQRFLTSHGWAGQSPRLGDGPTSGSCRCPWRPSGPADGSCGSIFLWAICHMTRQHIVLSPVKDDSEFRKYKPSDMSN